MRPNVAQLMCISRSLAVRRRPSGAQRLQVGAGPRRDGGRGGRHAARGAGALQSGGQHGILHLRALNPYVASTLAATAKTDPRHRQFATPRQDGLQPVSR